MKLLLLVNESLAGKSKPYTPEEINNHEDSGRIWATLNQCRRAVSYTPLTLPPTSEVELSGHAESFKNKKG